MAQPQKRRLYLMTKYIFLFSLTIFNTVVFGQTQEEKVQQLEMDQVQAYNAEIMRTMDKGIDLMEAGDYEEANLKYKEVLAKAKVVPTDLTFYFGKNSFLMGKYKQSIDWLNKYIELKGTSGRYYTECLDYLDKSNKAFMLIREEERKEAQTILSSNYQIDCGPSGKVICPVCSGNGVIIQRGSFGSFYKTCPYSDDHGYLTCEEYNLLLRGELKPKF
jgi:tetratricopeptide (TPR) repeat protein